MLSWYINRLKTMNIKEILYRTKIKIYSHKLQNSKKLFDESIRINYINMPLKIKLKINNKKIFRSADLALNNEVLLFNDYIKLGEKDKYITDPITNNIWKYDFFTKINYRKKEIPGDPKLIWEINKQQFLIGLSEAYNISGESKYADKVLKEINLWIDENPKYRSINWASGLEMSLRNISWIFSLSMIKNYITENNIDIRRIKLSLFTQADFIYHKLSLYSSANNHLIGELMFLLYCNFFIDCNSSQEWRKKAKSLLEKQITNQFYKDGVNREQSINYQLHTMEMYFLCDYILKLNDDKFNNKVYSILKESCYYINSISDSNGFVFNIGDEDSGAIIKVHDFENKVLSILQFASITFNNYKHIENKNQYFDNKLNMLFGEKYVEFYKKVGICKPLSNEKIYKHGGMYINKKVLHNGKENILSFDFGNTGMKPIYAHAHNDILSFNFMYNSKPVFIDCGTYKYNVDNGWRNYFRGVHAHNTISIDNKNQFELLGPFLCSKSPITKLKYYNGNIVEAETNAYKKNGCIVSRKIIVEDNSITISDNIRILDNNKHQIEIFFNFDNGTEISQIDNNIFEIKINNDLLYLMIDKKLHPKLYYGFDDKNIKYGWLSKNYYKSEKTYEIVCSEKDVNYNRCYKNYIFFNKQDLLIVKTKI